MRTTWVLVILATAVCGCAHRESIGRFSDQPVAPFSESGSRPLPDRWWTELGDVKLNARVQQALTNNYDVAAALQRVSAARAVARRQASDFFPDVNGVVNADSVFGPGDDVYPSIIGLDANYIVDLWGRIDALVEAERLRASSTRADFQTIQLVVASEVTGTWLSLIEANAQLELLDEQIETNRTGLELQEARFGEGLVRSPDVLRQRQLLESTLEQYAVAQAQIETLEHQLATLLGDVPQTAQYDSGTRLPELSPLPTTGLPAELLRRRPDVRRAYLAFAAADRDLAAAISDQFPRLNLTGSLLNAADRPEDLFRDWFVSIGSQLVAPLLDGGQRRAEVDRTAAVTRLRFNEYGQTMLIAFREVEDALVREFYQIERLKHLNNQVDLARQSSEQLREQYLIGDEDYLAVLTALTGWQRLQRDALSAQLELRLIRVSLYLALAGGIDSPSTPPSGEIAVVSVDPSDEGRESDRESSDGEAGGEPIPLGEAVPDDDPVLPPPNDVSGDFPGADIPGADIPGADIPGADIPGAVLGDVPDQASVAPNRLPPVGLAVPPAETTSAETDVSTSIRPLLLSTPNPSDRPFP